jgi:ABC-2 type transport system permease protein
MIRGIRAIVMLDLKRFWLDRARLFAGMIQPLLYLFVLGAGLGGSSRMGGGDYRRFIFPGTMALSLLFSAVFAAIVIVFDRQIGFFKAVLVSPVPRPAIAFGKILSGAIQSFSQGLILLLFAPLAGVSLSFGHTIEMLGAMALAAITFSSLGVAVAARFTSTTVFPIVSNAVLLPMFFLSGALYPMKMAPVWMQRAVYLDPVAYAVDLMRGALLGSDMMFFPPWLPVPVILGCVGFLGWMAVRIFQRGEETDIGPSQFTWRR